MEAMHMYKSDKGVIRTAQPADILPARSDVELVSISSGLLTSAMSW